jgi:hypothetical protein
MRMIRLPTFTKQRALRRRCGRSVNPNELASAIALLTIKKAKSSNKRDIFVECHFCAPCNPTGSMITYPSLPHVWNGRFRAPILPGPVPAVGRLLTDWRQSSSRMTANKAALIVRNTVGGSLRAASEWFCNATVAESENGTVKELIASGEIDPVLMYLSSGSAGSSG